MAVLVLSGAWLAYALEGGSIWLPLVVSATLLSLLAGLLWLAARKAARTDTPAREESGSDRRLRQQAELAGSLAPRGMGPHVNGKGRTQPPSDP